MFELTSEMIWPMAMVVIIYIVGVSIIFSFVADKAEERGKRKYSPSLVFSALFISPVLEEFISRGPVYLLREFSIVNWLVIVVWSGFFFGLLHGIVNPKDWKKLPNKITNIRAVSNTTLLGILQGWLMLVTSSFAAVMIVHAANNFTAISLIGVLRLIKRLIKS